MEVRENERISSKSSPLILGSSNSKEAVDLEVQGTHLLHQQLYSHDGNEDSFIDAAMVQKMDVVEDFTYSMYNGNATKEDIKKHTYMSNPLHAEKSSPSPSPSQSPSQKGDNNNIGDSDNFQSSSTFKNEITSTSTSVRRTLMFSRKKDAILNPLQLRKPLHNRRVRSPPHQSDLLSSSSNDLKQPL